MQCKTKGPNEGESRIGVQEGNWGRESKRGQRNKGGPLRIKKEGLPVFLLIRLLICIAPISAQPEV